MEDLEMLTSTAFEIDPDYEFDAERFYDFCTAESISQSRQSELWFEFLGSYPPSPFIRKLLLREDTLSQNVTTSPKTKMSQNIVLPEINSNIGAEQQISAMDASNSDNECTNRSHSTNTQSCALPNLWRTNEIPTGLTFYNHMTESKNKNITNPKRFVSRISTLMKPTASQLAKQIPAHNLNNYRFARSENKDKILSNTSALENQPAKRQKLAGGQLRKVADINQETYLVHKERKRDGNTDSKSTQAKLHLTIPKEPDLRTAHRAQRLRAKVSGECEQVTSTTHTFRARLLNRKILEAPTLLLPKRSTPRIPEFQEFHLKTSERALQHNASVPSYSVHCNNYKVSHQPSAGSVSECGNKDSLRQAEATQEGYEMHNKFKATPLNKKIFSSRGEIGVFRSNKREATVPKEFNFHTERRLQQDPPVDLFKRLTLESNLRSNVESHFVVPQPTLTSKKHYGSKENGMVSFEQESKVVNLVQGELQGIKTRQIPLFGGVNNTGGMASISRNSSMR